MKEQCTISDSNPHAHMGCFKTLSWTAVVAGALVGVGLSFLLNLFGAAIGLTAFTTNPQGAMIIAVGGFIGLVIGTYVVMFVAGWVAGYLARPYSMKKNMGELYGFTAWCLALVLGILLASQISQFVSMMNYSVNRNAAVVRLTSNDNAPMVQTRARTAGTGTQVVVNAEKAATTAGLATFVTFFLFFIGALGSAFGGRCGIMSCRRNNLSE